MGNMRHALRQLIRRPALSLIVIGMLAVGVGATTAMFSWVHTLILEPLPVPEPARLVNLGAPGPKPGSTSCSFAGDCEQVFSYPMFRDLEAQQRVFSGIAGHRFFRANLAFDGRTLAAAGSLVSGGYFGVLGIQPAAGRLISPADEPQLGESAVVVLSYEFWRDAFGRDRSIIGQTLDVNGSRLSIIGVAPEGFSGTTVGARPHVFVPLSLRWAMEPAAPTQPDNRLAYWIYAFARLGPGITPEQAEAGINTLYSGIVNDVEASLNQFLPVDVLERFRSKKITVTPGALGQSDIRTQSGEPLILLLGLTSIVLLIVCVNIANLLLARAASRRGEFAMRASIGASPMHLFGQALAESLVLAIAGGFSSVPIAALILSAIEIIVPTIDVGAGFDVNLSGAALGFAALATCLTVALFGIVPAVTAARAHPGTVVKGQASQAASSIAMSRFRETLAVVQVGFSMVLLAMAGLFAQSIANVGDEDLGLDADALASFTVSPRLSGFDTTRTQAVFDDLERALISQPGVVSAASARVAMIADNNSRNALTVQGFDAEPTDDTTASTNDVSPGFFETMGIPLLAGRDFTDADVAGRQRVAVVNRRFLEKFGLGFDAIGTRFAEGREDGAALDIEIVGIAADAKYSSVKDAPPPQYFLPRAQDEGIETMTFYVRSIGDPEALFDTIRRTVAAVDGTLPIATLTTMRRTVSDNVFFDRMIAIFSSGFALLATALAAIGLYGVLAYNVVRRRRELGVRLALGATPSRLRNLVLRQVGRVALLGIPLGLVAATLIGRGTSTLLFGLSGSDPAIFALSAAVLAGVVAAAGWLPAHRAARLGPMEALRYE